MEDGVTATLEPGDHPEHGPIVWGVVTVGGAVVFRRFVADRGAATRHHFGRLIGRIADGYRVA